MKKGKVEFGAYQRDDKHIPFIAIILEHGKRIEYICAVSFETEELAYNMSGLAHSILSGPQLNLKYSREGLKEDDDA